MSCFKSWLPPFTKGGGEKTMLILPFPEKNDWTLQFYFFWYKNIFHNILQLLHVKKPCNCIIYTICQGIHLLPNSKFWVYGSPDLESITH